MSRQRLTLATLLDLDGGRIAEAWLLELQRIELDLVDRPALKATRTLTLKLTLSPVAGEDGRLEETDVDFAVDAKLPRRKTRTYSMRTNGQGELFASIYAPEDARQGTIDEAMPKEVAHAR